MIDVSVVLGAVAGERDCLSAFVTNLAAIPRNTARAREQPKRGGEHDRSDEQGGCTREVRKTGRINGFHDTSNSNLFYKNPPSRTSD